MHLHFTGPFRNQELLLGKMLCLSLPNSPAGMHHLQPVNLFKPPLVVTLDVTSDKSVASRPPEG